MFVTAYIILSTVFFASASCEQQFEDCYCGRLKQPGVNETFLELAAQYIVGGSDAYEKYHWMANVLYGRAPVCGATLLNSHFVLTSASCVQRFPARVLKVRLNAKHRFDEGFVVPVREKLVHPNFVQRGIVRRNDIALLHLASPVPVTKFTPACLPLEESAANLTRSLEVYGLGFGKSHSWSNKLQKATMNELNIVDCMRRWPKVVIQDNVCAGGSGQAMCAGDFGGPLMAVLKDYHYVYGVSSFSWCRATVPSLFTRVSSHLPWIREIIEEHSSPGNESSLAWCKSPPSDSLV